jgi:HlyD family secretion protein
MSKVFRKTALDKLQSPDRLNEMVTIISSHSWLALVGASIIIGFFVTWSIVGKLPTQITGNGILLMSGGVMDVSAISQGQISEVLVKPGDAVFEGDILVKVKQPDLELKYLNSKEHVRLLKERYESIKNFNDRDLTQKRNLLKQDAENKKKRIEKNLERIEFVKNQIKSRTELLQQGLITNENLNQTKEMLFEIEQQNLLLSSELEQIELSIFEQEKQMEFELSKLNGQIIDEEAALTEIKSKLDINSDIRCPYTGRVVELKVNPGKIIGAGNVILSIERIFTNEELEAIIYVPSNQGKKIKPDMEVKISPSTIEVEKYGFIRGVVTQVSEYPASFEGMLNTLGNKELVATFFQGLPPLAVRVKLKKNLDTPSGFYWTSGNGPEAKVKSGTLCSAKIVVKNRRPISLIFPAFE